MSASLRNRLIIFGVVMVGGLLFLWPTINVLVKKEILGGKSARMRCLG